jgi:O-methyltransferase involved in polyketide biosynthesis
VLLGAGMDTFAYRQPSWAARLRIFEVDHPESQTVKRKHLAKRGIAVPANVEFCPIDFEHRSLAEGLATSSLDHRAPTFFSWLGVTQYLTKEAIDSTLRFLLAMPRRSELVMGFVLPPDSWRPEEVNFLTQVVRRAGELGEPWLTFFTPNEISDYLMDLGFSHVSHLTPEDAAARYFKSPRWTKAAALWEVRPRHRVEEYPGRAEEAAVNGLSGARGDEKRVRRGTKDTFRTGSGLATSREVWCRRFASWKNPHRGKESSTISSSLTSWRICLRGPIRPS